MSALATATRYIRMGWSPLPIPHRTKKPAIQDWPALHITDADVARYFNGKPQNVGVILGPLSGGLSDIDLDCEEAVRLAPRLLPRTGAVFGRTNKRASHWLYVTDLAETADKAVLRFADPTTKQMLVELRIGGKSGAQTVFPGSTHESGEPIEWEPGRDGMPATMDGTALRFRVGAVAAGSLLARHWPGSGARHEFGLVLGGFLARAGWTADDAASFVEAVAAVAGDPDPKDRIKAARDAAEAHRAGKTAYGLKTLRGALGAPVADRIAEWIGYQAERTQGEEPAAEAEDDLARLNAKYCVIRDGGRTRVLTFDPRIEKDHSRLICTLLSFEDFRNYLCNKTVRVGDRSVPLGTWWLRHPERRQYDGITFQPGEGEEVQGRLNLWRGWGVEPKPGDWSLMRQHIEKVLAAGDAASAKYIINWVAWAFQNPAERAQAAPVFKGKRGTGKGTLGNALCRIFGQHGTHISSAEHLAGRFNGHLRDACVLFADEAYWPGDKGAEGSLKRLVTEPDLFVEAKGRDGVTVPNMLHILMASNEDWIVPAGEDERRYAVFEVSDCHKQDETWFKPLYAEMENGGLGAMLYDLLRLDLGDWHPRRIPRTRALLDQQARGLSPEDEWWVGLLEAGQLPACDPRDPSRAVSNDYTIKGGPYGDKETTRRGLYHYARTSSPRLKSKSATALGLALGKHGCVSGWVMRRRGWVFPPLCEARAAWEARFPGWAWQSPNLTEWQPDEE